LNQSVIKELLIEASQPTCTSVRREQILASLSEAVWPGDRPGLKDGTNNWSSGISMVINALYVEAFERRPDQLPVLHPVFATLCEEREDLQAILEEASVLAQRKHALTESEGMRVCKIQTFLRPKASLGQDCSDQDGREVGMQIALCAVYIGAIQHAPERLVGLFPLVAVICGDRDRLIHARVDWSLVP
jgi:hypothetical protein